MPQQYLDESVFDNLDPLFAGAWLYEPEQYEIELKKEVKRHIVREASKYECWSCPQHKGWSISIWTAFHVELNKIRSEKQYAPNKDHFIAKLPKCYCEKSITCKK